MKNVLAWAFILLSLGLGAAACSDNPKATEACKEKGSAGDCQSCCHENGAAGYKFLSSKCGCLN
jgi:hypothetical protein